MTSRDKLFSAERSKFGFYSPPNEVQKSEQSKRALDNDIQNKLSLESSLYDFVNINKRKRSCDSST